MRFFKMAVAIDQHNYGFKLFGRPPRCKLQSYSQLDFSTTELTQTNLTYSHEHAALDFPNIHKSYSTPCLSLSTKLQEDNDLETNPRIEIIAGHGAPQVHALVVEAAIILASGINPEPVSSGLGGAYFLQTSNGIRIAVAKPIDEEPLAVNNPKGFGGRMLGQPGLKPSIRVGETGFRELAAYLLDHGGFAGVPPTALVKISHVAFNVNGSETMFSPPYKIASLQRFVDHDSDAGDMGPSCFSVASVHSIGILDIRLLNLDRHAGNILLKQRHHAVESTKLVPIDHGLCLPESLDDPYFEWLHWPQASIPFSESEIEYISSLDPFKDADLIRTRLPSIRESSVRVLVVCTIFLKSAAASGLCLADIGKMMTREFCGGEERWSALETLCSNAKASLETKVIDIDINIDQDIHEEINEVFQFDVESERVTIEGSNCPKTSRSSLMSDKPPKIPRFSSLGSKNSLDDTMLNFLCPKNVCDDDVNNSDMDGDGTGKDDCDSSENMKGSGLMKSKSYSAAGTYKTDCGGICFGEMSGKEWYLFLEVFEKLLPEAFEARKCGGLSKQRLGSSY
ncbi:PREDICTED: phosphatidylinositol 4-kinase gamma 8-like [Ipomoea nil]|uniref:phosphatidylinositol 4-kinase gamma 8-like n=1 Tax=Ipomoea nil TaxID=35883 RepID=UPI00090178BB|nr:PREDICTED: phosphatidylinositol 4-kinase gamma 8-like [Ipomoea nil]